MAAPLTSYSSIGRNGERQTMRAASSARQAESEATGRVRRGAAVVLMLAAGLLLAACAGTSNEDAFSAYVADHWPHWAGGMPGDVPPRAGAPGYNEFIAHGQADQEQTPPAGANGAAAAPVTPVFQTTPGAPAPALRAKAPAPVARAAPAPVAAQAAPPQPAAPAPVAAQAAPAPAADDTSVVHGGLY
jgi:hypothetical protein